MTKFGREVKTIIVVDTLLHSFEKRLLSSCKKVSSLIHRNPSRSTKFMFYFLFIPCKMYSIKYLQIARRQDIKILIRSRSFMLSIILVDICCSIKIVENIWQVFAKRKLSRPHLPEPTVIT